MTTATSPTSLVRTLRTWYKSAKRSTITSKVALVPPMKHSLTRSAWWRAYLLKHKVRIRRVIQNILPNKQQSLNKALGLLAQAQG